MDAMAMNMAVAQTQQVGAARGLYSDGSTGTVAGLEFSDILSALSGTGSGNSGDVNTLAGMLMYGNGLGSADDSSSDLASMFGLGSSMNWQSNIQSTLLNSILQSMGKSDEPALTDSVLSELLQKLMGMMESVSGEEGEAETADILDIVKQMQQRLQKLSEDYGSQLAGEQLLAILAAANGQTASYYNELPAEATNVLLSTVLEGDPASLVKLFTGADLAPAQAQTEVAETVPVQAEIPQAATNGAQAADTAQGLETELAADVVETTADTGSAAAGDARFQGMLRAVREQVMQTQPQAEADGGETKLDVDAIQQQVDAGTHLQNTALASATQVNAEVAVEQTEQPVLTQISEGLAAGLENGKDEFTIKLAPEELGEVTIRLVKTAEGMSLDLIAKNPDTQRMLEGQMELLRENLRPMKVEVSAVMTEAQYDMLASSQQQSHNGRQMDWRSMRGAAYYGDEPLGSGTEQALEGLQSVAAAPTSALDTYI